MLSATSTGVVAIIAASGGAVGAIIGQLTIAVRMWTESRRADRHQDHEDRVDE